MCGRRSGTGSSVSIRQTTTVVVRGLGRAFLCLSVCLSSMAPLSTFARLFTPHPCVGAALSITKLYYFIDSYLVFSLPWAIHRFFHSIRTSVTQTSDSLPWTRVRPATRSWGAQAARGGCNSCIGIDALREEVAPSIGFVLDTRFLGSPWLDTRQCCCT